MAGTLYLLMADGDIVAVFRQCELVGNIAFVEEDGLDATKAYADACWRRDPEISPSSWRVSQGFTLGKVAFDGRGGWQGLEAAVGVGCNVLVGTEETLQQVPDVGVEREALVRVCVVGNLVGNYVGNEVVLLKSDGGKVDGEGLRRMEQAVKDGEIGCYGMAVEGVFDMGAWLVASDEMAAEVWGRRKRSGFKALMVPFNLPEQGMLREVVTTHKDEPVSVLELAARRDMLVLAERGTHWRGPWGEMAIESEGDVAARARALLDSRMPEGWQGASTRAQAWGMMTSVPGVTVAVGDLGDALGSSALREALVRGDVADVASVLG